MRAKKDPKTGKWYIRFRYTDWQGKRRETMKRGFETKREAEEWLRTFLAEQKADLNITFADFTETYFKSISPRLRENTLRTKHYIIDLKIMPYFGLKRITEITPANIIAWENELLAKGYSQTYMKTVYNQLNAIFNYAVKYYNLQSNPCSKAGAIGKNKAEEMNFWTKDEFQTFIESMKDRPASYTVFMTMYYTGIREGELLALTPSDIDFEKKTLTVNKSYQRLGREDIITTPKTPKSIRTIPIPDGLCTCLQEYMSHCYGLQKDDRLFPYTKSFLYHEMEYGCKASGVKRIRVHDIRHSHASLLVEMGFSPLLIAERLGHEKVQTTMDTYSHLYPNKQVEVARQLDGIMP